jgi:hypothetical protein
MKTNLTAETLTRTFQENELQFLNLLFPNSGYTITEQFSRQDAIHNKYKLIIEVKVREFSQEYFDDKFNGEFLIEKEKYDELILASKKLNYTPLYIFGFKPKYSHKIEGYSAINFNKLSLSGLSIQKRMCPKSQWNKTLVEKDCYIIPNKLLNKENQLTRIFR